MSNSFPSPMDFTPKHDDIDVDPPPSNVPMDPDVDPVAVRAADNLDEDISVRHELLGGSKNEEAVRQLNSFIRGEISAVETYRMAVEKLSMANDSNISDVSVLRQIQMEHGRTAQALRDRIRELGGTPADSSGVWGVWAKFTMEAAKIFGQSAALKMLKEGEEHGLKDFRDGIDKVDGTTAHLIQNQFIPAQQRHIDLLDELISTSGNA